MIDQLNTKSVANSGALLVFTAVTVLTKLLNDVNACGQVPWAFFALDFAAIFVGAGLCYLGMPATLKQDPPASPPPGKSAPVDNIIPLRPAA